MRYGMTRSDYEEIFRNEANYNKSIAEAQRELFDRGYKVAEHTMNHLVITGIVSPHVGPRHAPGWTQERIDQVAYWCEKNERYIPEYLIEYGRRGMMVT